ncbi:hypothetical protein CQW23_17191 [Capsicum baccatum]|uniref:Uncharacterized protein n=1 Tax=Capsicum baccatum TaxID=33114 RepID=A0A2G2WD28_CAPBA|nr:hypothetical protein CQW23_17191 [Capsicum baccatum]
MDVNSLLDYLGSKYYMASGSEFRRIVDTIGEKNVDDEVVDDPMPLESFTLENEKLRSNSQNFHCNSIEQAFGSDQMTKVPSKICSNPSNLVFDDPTVVNLAEHSVWSNVNEIGQSLATNSNMGNINLTKVPSNYPQGTINLKIRASNEIVDVVDSEVENSNSSDSDDVKEVVMDTISSESNNSLPISVQMDANIQKKLSLKCVGCEKCR